MHYHFRYNYRMLFTPQAFSSYSKWAGLFVCLFLMYGRSARACSCREIKTVKERMELAQVIFTGTVIDVLENTVEDNNSFYYLTYKYTFLIEKMYKGEIRSDTLVVETGSGGADCGYPFTVGKKYVVYANLITSDENTPAENQPILFTGICHRTRPFDKDEIEEIEKLLQKN